MNKTNLSLQTDFNPKNIKTRYIKVKATNINECPEYHPGSGGSSWIFSDEIIIN